MKKSVFYKDIKTNLLPEEAYLRLTRKNQGILFETSEHDTGYTFICCDPKKKIQANKNIVAIVKEEITSISIETQDRPYVGGAYGNIAYDSIRDFEVIPETNKDTLGVTDSSLLVCDFGLIFNHNNNTAYFTSINETLDEANLIFAKLEKLLNTEFIDANKKERDIHKEEFTSTPNKEKYINNVKRAKEYIIEGDIFQVVLSQRFTQKSNMDSFDFYRKLKKLNPSPYMFYLDFGTHQIIGSSPERLVSLNNEVIKTVPIAGTRKRGLTPEEDEFLAKDLLADEKEKCEHRMLIDLARNDLARVSKTGSVEVTEMMQVKMFSHVMHIVSLVESKVLDSQDAYGILSSVLPAGTLSGAPKIRAMEIIEELEEVRRGFYGGAIGYINYSGEMDTCIAIRTALHKDGVYSYQAGAGIVADSVPESEYQECLNKGMSITKIFSEVS